MLKKELKVFLSLALVVGLIFSGLSINLPYAQASNKNPELTALKSNLETNGMVYITDNAVDTQKKIDFNKEDITTKITSLKLQDYIFRASSNIKNIVVDATLLSNEDLLTKVRASYNNGAKIVIRKDNIKVSDAYSLMGEKIPEGLTEVETGDQSKELTTVAVSMFKDSSGNIHPAKMNVEINNSDEVLRVIIIALRDDDVTSPYKNSEQSFIQTIKPAQATLFSSWPAVVSWPSYDQFISVDINWACALYKSPTNPDSNLKYWSVGDGQVTVTPRSGYLSGGVHIKLTSNSSGVINAFAPTPFTNKSSVSMSLGVPAADSLSINFNTSTNMVISQGGVGYPYTDFAFTPVYGPLTQYQSKQTFYEASTQYLQDPAWFGLGFYYTVDMYEAYTLDWFATASHSGLSISGT